jgi:hypothetical protein
VAAPEVEAAEFVLPEDFLTLGDLADAWMVAHCRTPDGFARGKPLTQADWQFWCTAHRYAIRQNAEFVPPEEVGPDRPPVLNQAFVYQQTLIVGPQKLGKGPWTASQVAFEACGPSVFAGFARGGELYRCDDNGCPCGWTYAYLPGEPMGMRHPSPLIQITGFSEDGADNIYRPLRAMIRLGPLKHMLAVREGFIRVLGLSDDDDLDRIDVVTSSANSRLGNPISDAEQDELGLWTGPNKMQNVADTQARGAAGMGGRTHGTTNAWDPAQNSVAQQIYEAGDDDVFIFYRNPDVALVGLDGKPLRYSRFADRQRIHAYVYKGSWWVNLDSIEGRAAKLLKRDPAQAERFFGNRLLPGSGAYIPDGLWVQRTVKRTPKPQITLGFDGSTSGDWTALRAEDLTGLRFTPTYDVGGETRSTIWNPTEHPNGRIPRSEVRAAVAHIFANYEVKRMYCDPRDWQTEIDEWATTYGEEVVVAWPTNQIGRMFDALNRYLTDLSEDATAHLEDRTVATHAGNAIKIAKPGDKYILTKPSDHQKIDALMADVLAHEAAADARAEGWEAEDDRMFMFR